MNLEVQLSKIADRLRGKMNSDEYKSYILGFIFYKYLSENYKNFLSEFGEDLTPEELKGVQDMALNELGYYLEDFETCEGLLEKGRQENILEDLQNVFQAIEARTVGTKSQEDFEGLFDDIDLTSSKLGENPTERNAVVVDILTHLHEINYNLEDKDKDILGDAYEYLISNFAASAGKRGGEFYTPQAVSKLLARIVSLGKKDMASVYDPTCGSGSLLLQVKNYSNVRDLYGQELNPTTYNLSRMNMLMHKIPFSDFDIKKGNTLENPKHIGKKFEGIIANPPYSAHWNPTAMAQDERFSGIGKMAPKTKADFAFVQHMLAHLAENGTMAVVLPHGVLFRGSGELAIRKWLIDSKNSLDAVIGLPANIFYGTSIPTVVLVFKKCRKEDEGILFIDASAGFSKEKNQNVLEVAHVDRIVDCYASRSENDKFSRVVPISEIRENDFNLNIPRYIDTFEEEEAIDLSDVFREIAEVEEEGRVIDRELSGFYSELGV